MLQELNEFGKLKGFVSQEGFKRVTPKWLIQINQSGDFLDLIPSDREFLMSPEPPNAYKTTGEVKSNFLIENLETITGWVKEGKNKKQKSEEEKNKMKKKMEYFFKLIEQAQVEISCLSSISLFLNDEKERGKLIEKATQNTKLKSLDLASFMISNYIPLDNSEWHSWWEQHLAVWRSRARNVALPKKGKASSDVQPMVCVVSGQIVAPVLSHDPIDGYSGIFGVLGSGDRLVSFDKQAFRSFGLDKSLNAAMDQESVNAYRKTLTYLLKNQSQKLGSSIVTYWYKGIDPDAKKNPIFSLFDNLDELDELDAQRQAQQTLQAVNTGESISDSIYLYRILVLGRSEARVVVRDWYEGTLKKLEISVNGWLNAVTIMSLGGVRKKYGLEKYATSVLSPRLEGQKFSNWIKPLSGFQEALLAAAISEVRTKLPAMIPSLIAPKMRNFFLGQSWADCIDEKNGNPKERPRILALLYARMGLLKAYFLGKGDPFIGVEMNQEHSAPEYHCGRLLAVIADLQRMAMPEIGAGITQRFYGALSQAPALHLGRILGMANHYYPKLASDKMSESYRLKVAEVCSKIGDKAPRTLNLEQQSLFALGYYQQMAFDRAGKAGKQADQQTKGVAQ